MKEHKGSMKEIWRKKHGNDGNMKGNEVKRMIWKRDMKESAAARAYGLRRGKKRAAEEANVIGLE